MIGSMAIFGENCIDLVTAAWNTNKQDLILQDNIPIPMNPAAHNDTCFQVQASSYRKLKYSHDHFFLNSTKLFSS